MKLKNLIRKLTRVVLALAAVVILTPVARAGNAPEGVLDVDHPHVKAAIAVQELVTPGLMAQPEILGTAIGQDDDGEIALVIYVNSEAKNHGEVMRALPPTLKGKRVRPELTEPFRAFGKSGGGVSHTAKQTPPIQLGTSGGWRNDLANGYCCGGTLGSLVKIGTTQYILSNYHVFESDIVSGGNGRVATTGDPIIQPGLIDVNCSASAAQNVGTLVKKSSLPNSNVDCSMAQVIPGMVRTDGAILEIGTISASTVSAFITQKVKKSGRTTRLTRSSISGLNATVSVAYDNECAGGAAFTKTFTGQILIANRGSRFLAGGDSGSLMVEDVSTNPRAVGLLFAGSSSIAVANPIDEVLSFLGATMVGN
ncbi:MAG TPA: hypothetical protein VJA21_08420 [Verrucomicrobiae bacterium]